MWRQILPFGLATLCLTAVLGKGKEDNVNKAQKSNTRENRLFSVLQVISFPNDGCVGSSSRNGTCFTSAECTAKGGTASGTCAQSYGVCCIFQLGCGTTSTQNCTYFTQSSSTFSGACKLKICPCNSNICQLRLDFNTFSINGPTTNSLSVIRLVNGELVTASAIPAGIPAALSTRCLVDTFQVTNPGGLAPPLICGSNSGVHMYVDASQECNDLTFQIGSTTTGASWDMKVTQYSCNFNNLAPPGCTQYFSGNGGVGIVKTFNYDGGLHLANQNQAICVRSERGLCRICWYAMAAADVKVSSPDPVATERIAPNVCCRYGNNGLKTTGFDCIIIPGAMKGPAAANTPVPSRQCGRSKGLVTATVAGGASNTVCSCQTPYLIRFMSDNYEFTGVTTIAGAIVTRSASNISPDIGFKLHYYQTCP